VTKAGRSLRLAGSLTALVVALCACSPSEENVGSPSGGARSIPGDSAAPTASASPSPSQGSGRPQQRLATLADELVAAEQVIDDASAAPPELRRAAHVQQVVYRELGGHPEWRGRLLRSVPANLRAAVRANVAARMEFRSMHPPDTLSDTLPAWRIVRPAPMRDLLRYYRQGEAEYGVDWEYLASINLVETGLGRIRGFSTAGAQGPMQFIPSTWAAYGEGDINDPEDAIMGAARYLAANGFTRPGGVAGALRRYNNSAAYVRGVTLLAEVMKRRPRAFRGYYHWQIYYATKEGDVLLRVGYSAKRPIPVKKWQAEHPQP
jgi:soluble lytic murein transglycosylase-like protein